MTNRALHPDFIAAITSGHARPFMLFKFATSGGDVCLWAGHGDLKWNGDTYQGVGRFGKVSGIEESQHLAAYGIVAQLSAMNEGEISQALNDMKQGDLIFVYQGFFHLTTGAIIQDPYEIWSGKLNVPKVNHGTLTGTISISGEHRLLAKRNRNARRFTDQDQRITDPTDLGFNQVAKLQDAVFKFGK